MSSIPNFLFFGSYLPQSTITSRCELNSTNQPYGIPVIVSILRQCFGSCVFFNGVYLPQKGTYSPPLERERMQAPSIARAFLSIKISPDCFVWAQLGPTYSLNYHPKIQYCPIPFEFKTKEVQTECPQEPFLKYLVKILMKNNLLSSSFPQKP